ncbi:IS66 family insertion sequence element accessory protein TnpB [Mesorhizobium sp. M0118]|uniref:IS66 family insertion sequence element accessory protein TnpB n=1 Tax=Mesorhizobium sp. M0118 TaxID=2956884 RepID=UPI003337D65A
MKIIWHDGLGTCLRLEKGRFIWPNKEGGAVAISPAQLSYLLSGIDWRNPQETWRPIKILINLIEWLHDFEACRSSCGPCERLSGAAFRA